MSNSKRETDKRKIANPQDGGNLLQSLKQNKEAGRKSRKTNLRKSMNRNSIIALSTDNSLTQIFLMQCSATLMSLCIGCGIFSTGASPWRLCWLSRRHVQQGMPMGFGSASFHNHDFYHLDRTYQQVPRRERIFKVELVDVDDLLGKFDLD